METDNRTYLAIDLKSFYASVECMKREINPLTANLVVADESRTEKTICLAVSPALKSYGISGRARLFEVVQRVSEVNAQRRLLAPGHVFTGKSCDKTELDANPALELDYIVAKPQMAHYMECSTQIYNIYLKYIAPEDIHVYSIDEVFIDVTGYLKTYKCTARELAMRIIRDVLKTSGITATAGIGTNLYLCKIAMDIVAKKMPADEDGVRIAELDERSYRELLWEHRPLTDFWRVGRGIAKKLESCRIFTMGDIARCSLGGKNDFYNEDLLYKMFGVNAELLIDHAWGWESCTIADIKAYRPESNSLSTGQVLTRPYSFSEGRLIVREMADSLVLDLVEKGLVTDQIVLTVGYDVESLKDDAVRRQYRGEIKQDPYGRKIPKHAHGSVNLGSFHSSTVRITAAVTELYERIVDRDLLVRRLYVVANHVTREETLQKEAAYEQLDFFSADEQARQTRDSLARERKRQQAVLAIQKKYGKNALVKGNDLQQCATKMERNGQIGGHKA